MKQGNTFLFREQFKKYVIIHHIQYINATSAN